MVIRHIHHCYARIGICKLDLPPSDPARPRRFLQLPHRPFLSSDAPLLTDLTHPHHYLYSFDSQHASATLPTRKSHSAYLK